MPKRPMKREKRIPLRMRNWILDEEDNEVETSTVAFTEGYSLEIAGRQIGLHKRGHYFEYWSATDMKTGLSLDLYEEKRKDLLDWLITHEEELKEKFEAVKHRTSKQEKELENLVEKYNDQGDN